MSDMVPFSAGGGGFGQQQNLSQMMSQAILYGVQMEAYQKHDLNRKPMAEVLDNYARTKRVEVTHAEIGVLKEFIKLYEEVSGKAALGQGIADGLKKTIEDYQKTMVVPLPPSP